MTTFTTILYDLDGTLIDSVRLILDSYHHTLRVHGFPPRSDEYWLEGLGTPLNVQFGEWADDADLLEEMIATYREYNLGHHDQVVKVYPGVVDMVTSLKAHGCRSGLVTSKNRYGAGRGLRLAGLERAIEVMVCADDVEHPKPHPEPVLRALERLGHQGPAAGAVFVGDSVHDMQSGRAAGVATAAVLWGPFDRGALAAAAPDYWLETPADLQKLVLGAAGQG